MPKKILLIGPAWVGDMVMSQTLFRVLKSQQPDVILDVLAPPSTSSIATRMPEIRQSITAPLPHGFLGLKTRYQLGKRLRAEHYDQAIVLPNSWKSALIPWFARIPKRTGWHGEHRYGLLTDRRVLDTTRYPLMIERFMALAFPPNTILEKPYPFPALSIDLATRHEWVQKLGLTLDRPIVALCPGAAYGPSKRWPAEYFAALAERLIVQGFQCWLFGSKEDQSITAAIQHQVPDVIDLAGKTSLLTSIDLLSLASEVVTNDSGLMHIAAALNIPVLALYGSTSPDFTPPLTTKAKILQLHLECQPCFQRTCPLKHFRCMKELTPDYVLTQWTPNHAHSHR